MTSYLQKSFSPFVLICALSICSLSAVSGQFVVPDECYLGTGIGYAKEKHDGESAYYLPQVDVQLLSAHQLGKKWATKHGLTVTWYSADIAKVYFSHGGPIFIGFGTARRFEIGMPLQLNTQMGRRLNLHFGARPIIAWIEKSNLLSKTTGQNHSFNCFAYMGWNTKFGPKKQWIFQMQASQRLLNQYELNGLTKPYTLRFWALRLHLGFSFH